MKSDGKFKYVRRRNLVEESIRGDDKNFNYFLIEEKRKNFPIDSTLKLRD